MGDVALVYCLYLRKDVVLIPCVTRGPIGCKVAPSCLPCRFQRRVCVNVAIMVKGIYKRREYASLKKAPDRRFSNSSRGPRNLWRRRKGGVECCTRRMGERKRESEMNTPGLSAHVHVNIGNKLPFECNAHLPLCAVKCPAGVDQHIQVDKLGQRPPVPRRSKVGVKHRRG